MSYGLSGFVFAAGLFAIILSGAAAGPQAQEEKPAVATLAHEKAFKGLERPPVVFDHDGHTSILGDKSCEKCHHLFDEQEGALVYRQGSESSCTLCHVLESDGNKPALMDAYHDRCIACHAERRGDGLSAGSVTCEGCHSKGNEARIMCAPAAFEHALHLAVMETKGCEECHHVYDEESGATKYVEGDEGPCLRCHFRESGAPPSYMETRTHPGIEVRTLKRAAHGQCLDCHRSMTGSGEAAGPKECAGCHGKKTRPDAAAHKPVFPAIQGKTDSVEMRLAGGVMPAVTFDHKGHESRTEKCMGCHRLHIGALNRFDENFSLSHKICHQCHAASGLKMKGASHGPGHASVYHDKKSPFSCIGCHNLKEGEGPKALAPCAACHKGTAGDSAVASKPPEWDDKGPELVIIDQYSDKFDAVAFPHSFHSEMMGDCVECHHYNPDNKATRCSVCHVRALFDLKKPHKPGIVGAYHQRCMGCHREMGTGPHQCVECHKKRGQ